jgi:anaphase-promoting complex subunit 3
MAALVNAKSTMYHAYFNQHSVNKHDYNEAIDQLYKTIDLSLGDSLVAKQLCGLAAYEAGDWQGAILEYKRAREIEPWCMEGMDFYSTAMWHLGKDIELSYLSHDLLEISRIEPNAWYMHLSNPRLVTGNLFSLKKDHESALACFTRCVRLDPRHAYAHTLAGHELLATEDYEAALNSFQAAVQIDKQHYNGWNGLAKLYEKQERWNEADLHYEEALKGRQDSRLWCSKAMLASKLKHYEVALENIDKAIRMMGGGSNAWFGFQRAQILFLLERFDDSLEQCEELKDVGGANVWYSN